MTRFEEKLKKIGLNIAYYRKMKNMTQQDLADKVRVDRSHIGQIEAPNMYKSFSLEILCEIADALEITESKLLDFKD